MTEDMSPNPYPPESLDPEEDNGTMVENVEHLASHVVGHKIKSIHPGKIEKTYPWSKKQHTVNGTILTLTSGKKVALIDTDDCCAFTEIENWNLFTDKVDHIITGVGTTDGYSTWHIFCDYGDVLELQVGWSAGNPFYYGYGFDIVVDEAPKILWEAE